MKSTELKVARIGNSRGIRIPARTCPKGGYSFDEMAPRMVHTEGH